MFRYALLIGSIALSGPTLAQTTPQTATGRSDAATGTPARAMQTPSAGAMQPAPSTQPAPQAVTGDQVAQVIDAEFPSYDKNSDNLLSPMEFGAWMVALKAKSDPTMAPGTPAAQKWVDAAFAQADTDKNKTLTKTELTGFLSQGQAKS